MYFLLVFCSILMKFVGFFLSFGHSHIGNFGCKVSWLGQALYQQESKERVSE